MQRSNGFYAQRIRQPRVLSLPRLITALVMLLITFFSSSNLPARAVYAQSADWPTYLGSNARSDYNASESIINQQTAPNLKLRWKNTAAGSISSQPVLANGLIYWGSWDGLEHATNPATGVDLWTANLGQTGGNCLPPPQGVLSSATVATVSIGGNLTPVVFVGGGNVRLYALNANTGAVIWQLPLGSQPSHFLYSSTAFFNGSVYIGVASLADCPLIQGQLVQVNASDGQIQHTFNVVPNGCLGGSIWSTPAIDEATGVIYISTGNGGKCVQKEKITTAVVALRASDLTQIDSWQIPPPQQVKDSDFGSTPTFFSATINGKPHNMLGLINKNGIYYAFDRSNLHSGPRWQVTISKAPFGREFSFASSAWDGATLYVAGAATTINGQSCNGSLRALNPSTGTFLWEVCLSKVVYSPVMAVPGLAEIGVGASFTIFDTSTGQQLFTYKDVGKGTAFWGPGTIINGVLYHGNMDGNLLAFAP